MKKFEQLDDDVKLLLWHHPWDEDEKNQRKLLLPDTGPYFYFRRSKSAIHERLTQLIDHRRIPNVFIHGSPHIDNYAKTINAAGIVDFDRAYIGPYIWDIVCLLLAISFRNPSHHHKAISKHIQQAILEHYTAAFQQPEIDYHRFQALEHITPYDWELDTRSYLKSGKKWAKKLSLAIIDIHDPMAAPLLQDFINNSDQADKYHAYSISHIAYASGSFGRKRYVYVLEKPTSDYPVLVDIKQTKNYMAMPWTYVKWYRNPFGHDGRRLCEAAKLYAPDFVHGESYATINGVDYWGRLIPTLNRKPAKVFDEQQQLDFAQAGASQLGRGHRLSLCEITPGDFLRKFNELYPDLLKATNKIKQELMIIWQAYCQQFK